MDLHAAFVHLLLMLGALLLFSLVAELCGMLVPRVRALVATVASWLSERLARAARSLREPPWWHGQPPAPVLRRIEQPRPMDAPAPAHASVLRGAARVREGARCRACGLAMASCTCARP